MAVIKIVFYKKILHKWQELYFFPLAATAGFVASTVGIIYPQHRVHYLVNGHDCDHKYICTKTNTQLRFGCIPL